MGSGSGPGSATGPGGRIKKQGSGAMEDSLEWTAGGTVVWKVEGGGRFVINPDGIQTTPRETEAGEGKQDGAGGGGGRVVVTPQDGGHPYPVSQTPVGAEASADSSAAPVTTTAAQAKAMMTLREDQLTDDALLSKPLPRGVPRFPFGQLAGVAGGGSASTPSTGRASSGPTPRSTRKHLIKLEELGRGAGGIVHKAVHVPSATVVALKTIYVEDEAKRRQMKHELKVGGMSPESTSEWKHP